jgi:hypothetical protein
MEKRTLLTIIVFFALCVPAWADIKIKPKDHMQNEEPGKCAWCALETLGRTHGWKSLVGLSERRTQPARHDDMITELKAAKVDYEVQNAYEDTVYGEYYYYLMYQDPKDMSTLYVWECRRNEEEIKEIRKNVKKAGYWWIEKKLHWNSDFIRKAVEEDLGAAVSLDYKNLDPKNPHARHMLIVTHIDNDKVLLCDSNYPQGVIYEIPLFKFLEQWNGYAIVIKKPK